MDFLLGVGRSTGAADLKEKTERAKKVLEKTESDAEILNKLEVEGDDDPLYKQVLRGEAVKRMAVPAVAATTEHALQDFTDLLDKNPRSMKRFVNAYGVERALRTIEGTNVGLDQLARWTIVLLRWPIMAGLLRSDPKLVDKIGSDPGYTVPENARSLFTDDEIKQVIAGTKRAHGKPLDADAIRQCCGNFTSTSGQP